MEWNVLNIQGKKVGVVDLPEAVFQVEMNEALLHSVIKAYRSNRRQGTHATKTRSMVSGSGKKPFKQKGTGGARQGCSRSPLMPGGAVVHGPQPRLYKQKINEKMKREAMRIVLSDKVRNNKILVVDDFAVSGYSTKHVVNLLKNLSVSGTSLLTDERGDDFLYRSAGNIHKAAAKLASQINCEDILRHESLVLSKSALATLSQRLEDGKHESV